MRGQRGVQPSCSTSTYAELYPDETNSMSGKLSAGMPRSARRYQPTQRTVWVTHHPEPLVTARASRPAPTTQPPITRDTEEPKGPSLLGRRTKLRICLTLVLFFVGWWCINQLTNWIAVREDQFH
jgi:hypothetical protein